MDRAEALLRAARAMDEVVASTEEGSEAHDTFVAITATLREMAGELDPELADRDEEALG